MARSLARRSSILALVALAAAVLARAAGDASSWEQIRALVEDGSVRSIEELLPRLSQELRENFLLVYNSRSSLGASLQEPRVILSSKSGDLVVSFASSASMKNGNRLEVIERDSGGELSFRSVDFSAP